MSDPTDAELDALAKLADEATAARGQAKEEPQVKARRQPTLRERCRKYATDAFNTAQYRNGVDVTNEWRNALDAVAKVVERAVRAELARALRARRPTTGADDMRRAERRRAHGR
jgi:hypothetical protein